jgi:predicted ArsR family transcriptional regulator
LLVVTENLPGRITDPKALRALSHPTRWKLIELLGLEETATATRCAEFTGESVASCSYHLSILAKYGFVEEADRGHGREKPWRATSRRLSVSNQDLEPEAALAAETVSEVFLDHEFERMKEYVRRASREPEEWQPHTGSWSATPHLTVEELTAVLEDFTAKIDRYRARSDDPSLRPEGSRPVRLFLASYLPLPPPKHEE